MKRLAAFCLAIALSLLPLGGCQGEPTQKRYEYQFFDTFDTLVQIVGYTHTPEEFEDYAQLAHNRFVELHNMYDKFESHPGVNGIAAINLAAGTAPVKAEAEVLDLLEFCTQWQQKTGDMVEITLGPVITIWQEYLARYHLDYDDAQLPPTAQLEAAAALCAPEYLQIDRAAGTVFLTQEGAALDVGAVAKGFATELVASELQAAGWESFSISSGGNVRTCGEPLSDTTTTWSVGIQDPFANAVLASQDQLLDVLFVNDQSVVTSGDYQRFYMVGDQRIHHIIDPATLFPATHYRSVTVVTPHSGMADFLSTALFVMDYEEGRALADEYDVGVLWVFPDGTVQANDTILPLLRDRGGATNKR